MTSVICVTIRFLDPWPQFHGRQANGNPEWPPSPLRVYQAMVAAAATLWRNGEFQEQAVPALNWLASICPMIVTPKAARTSVGYRMYVPNNSGDLMTAAWARGNPDASMAEFRVDKDVRPVTLPVGSTIRYIFALTKAGSGHFDVLRKSARSITHLGWGIDLVSADVELLDSLSTNQADEEIWRPDGNSNSTQLRVALPETLNELVSKHQAFLSRIKNDQFLSVPPLSAFRIVGYRPSSMPAATPFACFQLLKPDASGVRSFDTVRRVREVAGMMRHAVAESALRQGWTREKVNTFIHGKTVDGTGPASGEKTPVRFYYLPLPTFNSKLERVESIRRVLVMAPSGCSKDVAWAQRALAGEDLLNDQGEATVLLNVLPKSDWVLKQYVQPSETWATVTPVILPGHDDCRAAKAERLLRAAFIQFGFDEELINKSEFEWRKVPFIAGTHIASRYLPPENLSTFPRYHVSIRFPSPVPGPIAVGSGRFRGFGLFISLRQSSTD